MIGYSPMKLSDLNRKDKKMKKRDFLKTAGIIILAGMLIVSCGDKDESKTPEKDKTEQTNIEKGNDKTEKDENNASNDFTFEIKETPLVESITVTDISPGDYYGIYSMSDGIFAMASQELSIGLMDKDGNILMPCEYSTRRKIHDGVTAVRNDMGLWGYFNVNEKRFILECKYDSVTDFSEGIGCYFDGEYFRYINTDGTPAIDDVFYEAVAFSDGLARVLYDDGCGYIDKTGELVISSDYVNFDDFHDGFARVHDEGVFGYMDKTGTLKYSMNCDGIYNFKDGLAAFVKDKKVGYINTKGEVVIEPVYDIPNQNLDEYFRFECGVAPVMKDGKYGFINGKGELVVQPLYDLAYFAVENIIRVQKDGLYGYVGTDGTVITDCIFKEASAFSEGVAYVMKDDRYYFINKEGKELTSERFDDVCNFTGGTAFVVKPDTFTWTKVTIDK